MVIGSLTRRFPNPRHFYGSSRQTITAFSTSSDGSGGGGGGRGSSTDRVIGQPDSSPELGSGESDSPPAGESRFLSTLRRGAPLPNRPSPPPPPQNSGTGGGFGPLNRPPPHDSGLGRGLAPQLGSSRKSDSPPIDDDTGFSSRPGRDAPPPRGGSGVGRGQGHGKPLPFSPFNTPNTSSVGSAGSSGTTESCFSDYIEDGGESGKQSKQESTNVVPVLFPGSAGRGKPLKQQAPPSPAGAPVQEVNRHLRRVEPKPRYPDQTQSRNQEPYTRARAQSANQDPYSRAQSANQDPDSRAQSANQDPYARTQSANQDPYTRAQSTNQDNQDPYALAPPTNQDPYTQTQSANQDPYTRAQSENQDPNTRAQSANQDPYTRAQSAIQDPYTRTESANQEPYTRAQSANQDPYTRAQSANQDPNTRAQSANQDPYTRAQSANPDPYVQAQSANVQTESAKQDPYVQTESANQDPYVQTESAKQDPYVQAQPGPEESSVHEMNQQFQRGEARSRNQDHFNQAQAAQQPFPTPSLSPPRPQMSREDAVKRAKSILSRGDDDEDFGERRGGGGFRGRGRGRGGGVRERGDRFEDEDEFLEKEREEKLKKMAETIEHIRKEREELITVVCGKSYEVTHDVIDEMVPDPTMDEQLIEAHNINCMIEFEPEYAMEFNANPDINEAPPVSLRDALEEVKPFVMAYEGIESQEEWEKAVEETLRLVPKLERLVDSYNVPVRITAKQQQKELKKIVRRLPENAPTPIKRFTERALLSLQSNPGWSLAKKKQFMNRLVGRYEQHK